MANVELESYSTLRNDASLLSYYRFESNLTDSKSALNGTNSGVTYAAGKFWNGGIFNGSSYFTLPTSTSFDLTSWTWNFWVKLNSTTAGINNIFDHWDETTGSGNYAWMSISHYTDWVNKFRTEVVISDGSNANLTTNTIDYWTSDTAYHLITVTLTGTTSVIYFDWTAVSTKTNHSSVNYSTNPVIYVGCRHREFTNSNDYFLSWEIDDMSIFSRVLSGIEINNYFNNTSNWGATVKALVLGWGWGWGSGAGWWGGWWGLVYNASFLVSPQTYTITVGAWGAWWASASFPWTNGQNSVFSSLTWTGWWGGGSNLNTSGINWWCGWGNSWTGWWSFVVGVGSQWFNWWAHSNSAVAYGSWWGWGMGAIGSNGTSTTGWNWWAGISNSISWSAVTYAGGGWGSTYSWLWTAGTWWTGGWGNASVSGSGSNGTANTGGWWWGSASDAGWNAVGTGGTGGSGIVIIAYTTGSITATWGTITTSWWDTIHTFTTSGTFTVTSTWTTNNSNFFIFF